MKKRIFLVCMAMSFIPAFAQPANPPDPDVPIQGIWILLVAGVIIGIRRALRNRKLRRANSGLI